MREVPGGRVTARSTDATRARHPSRTLLAQPRGFCGGVRRALGIIEKALTEYPSPIYCRREIVHNEHVVHDLKCRGVVFVNDVSEVPEGGVVVFSAHGAPAEAWGEASCRGLTVVDATCPFVNELHRNVKRFADQGATILVIGNPEHDEIVGIISEAPEQARVVRDVGEANVVEAPDPDNVAAITQTTLSMSDMADVLNALRARFPNMAFTEESDVCRATQERQRAVQALARHSDIVLVLGSKNSANTNRLVEVAEAEGTRAALISAVDAVRSLDFGDAETVGVTAGASTPEWFILEVVKTLKSLGVGSCETLGECEPSL